VMLQATYACPFCGKDQPQATIVSHNPQCYRTFCDENGMVPLCTCNTCKGVKAHDGDLPGGERIAQMLTQPTIKPEAAFNPSVSLALSSLTPPSTPSPATSNPLGHTATPVTMHTASKRDARHHIGQVCVICSRSKSPANVPLPIIFVGQFRQYMVCVKDHIKNNEKAGELIEAIDEQLEIIRAKGDTSQSVLEDGSEPHDKEEEEQETPIEHVCEGFMDLNALNRCKRKTDNFLRIKDDTNSELYHYFCETRHLVRFMIKYYCVQGKGTGRGRGQRGSTVSTKRKRDNKHVSSKDKPKEL